MKKLILSIVGEMGSGKDTFCDYVKENYPDVYFFRTSDPLKDVLKIFFDEIKREDQQWLAPLLKSKYGDDILIKATLKKTRDFNGLLILNGIRALGESVATRDVGGKILYITADIEKRWERLQTRGEKADDNVPFDKFQELHKAITEIYIPQMGAEADYKIENNGTKEEFYLKIKDLVDKIYVEE